MKKIKVATLGFSALLLATAPLASAQTNIEPTLTPLIQSETQDTVVSAYGKKFIISPSAEGQITDEELEAISMQATSDEIIINNVYTSLNDNNLRLGGASPERENNNVISPNAWYDLSIKWSVTKFVKQTDTPLQAKQIATVPAGGTKKISTKYTTKSSFTVSGSAKEKGLTAAVESNLTGDLTYTIEKTYTGPSIDSGYVSYVFWLTPFVNRGTWTAKGTGVPSGDEYGPYNGSYEEPTKFVEWTQPIK